MTELAPTLTAASERLAAALSRLETALEGLQSKHGALKQDRDAHKRASLEEQEKFRGLQSAAYAVSTRLDQTVAQIDAILKD